MNKALKTLQATIVILFFIFHMILMIFNWDAFFQVSDIHYLLGTYTGSLTFLSVSLSLFCILLFWLLSYLKDLRYEMSIMKQKEKKSQSEASKELEMENAQLKKKIEKLQKSVSDNEE